MKSLFAIFAAVMALTTPVLALGNCCPDDYYVGAEATFLRPCTSNLYYVFRGPINQIDADTPLGKLFAVLPDYTTGFNAWIGSSWCCGKVDARFVWQYLHATDSRTITASGPNEVLYAPKQHPTSTQDRYFNGLARSQVRTDFDTADIEMGYNICKCDLWLRVVGGLRYAMIGYRNEILYQGFEQAALTSFDKRTQKEHSWAW